MMKSLLSRLHAARGLLTSPKAVEDALPHRRLERVVERHRPTPKRQNYILSEDIVPRVDEQSAEPLNGSSAYLPAFADGPQ